MDSEQVARRLAAILAADVVGYSRLMAADEEGTHAQLQAHLRGLFDPKIEEHHGRVVKATGDGLLAVFESVVNAVRCAIEIQCAMVMRNANILECKRIKFRVGINVGDIIIEGGDIFGDGVNIAARLESVAEPGGISLSGVVHDQVQSKLDIAMDDTGEHQLKNIPRPVRVYRVRLNGSGQTRIHRDDSSIAVLPSSNVRRDALPCSNIPIRVPTHFMGRDDALAAIETALARNEGRVAITALHGLRGVGKTTLAAAFADRHRHAYQAAWWIRAQTESSMRADLVALGVRLGWIAADDKEQPALAVVMERLRHQGEGILLIFDNAIDPRELTPYLPRGGASRVLVTSNAHAWRGVAEPIEIQLWSKEIGADYLVARVGHENERAAGAALSEALGGLPLAHEQAAAYCERLGISFADYRRRFESTPARMLDDTRYAPAEYHDGLTVAKTFGLAIEEAAKLHVAAEPLMVYAALLAPEPIPLFLFAEGREILGEPLASALAGDGLIEAVAALRTFALLNREVIEDERDPAVTTETIRLHRLVREVAAVRRDAKAREAALRGLVEALTVVYPEAEEAFTDPKTWPRARRLDAHALALVDGNILPPKGSERRFAEILHRLASYRAGAFANYSQVRMFEERALAIREKVLGPQHPGTAQNLNDLGLWMEFQGHLAEARPLYERALAINEKALGPEHPATATNIHNLSRLLREQGDLAKARPLQERALALFEKALGPEHLYTLLSLSNLAGLLAAQGDFAGAQLLHERALTIREKVLGPEHPHTAYSLNNLAGCVQIIGDFARARLLNERALAICEKVLGPDHPDTARSLVCLAELLQAQGDVARARLLSERALLIRERVLGSNHPSLAITLNSLANCVRAEGDLAAARLLNERALAICESLIGPVHTTTARILESLAMLLQEEGNFAGARPLHQRALEIRAEMLGPAHRATAESLANLATLLNEEGDLVGARTYYERALGTFEMVSPEHPRTNRLRYDFARLLLATGSAAEGLTLSETALGGHEKILGRNHRWTKDSAEVTADVLTALGRADEALALRQRYGFAPHTRPVA